MDTRTFLFVLSFVLSVGNDPAYGKSNTLPPLPTDQGIFQRNHDIKDQFKRLEQRLQDQDSIFLQQERTIQRQRERLDQQKEQLEQLKRQMDQQQTDFVQRIEKQEEKFQSQTEQHGCTGDTSLAADERVPIQLDEKKRSDDTLLGQMEPVLNHVTQQVTEMTSDIQALKNADVQQNQARGTAYVRWGHASCPGAGELVYSGFIGGSLHTGNGGPANLLCLPDHPVYDSHQQPSGNGHTELYGSEYNTCPERECNLTPACAVCRVSRASTVMIPATNRCTAGWTKEYSGYLMAGNAYYTGPSEYICVDASLASHSSSQQHNNDQNMIYYVHSACGSMPCLPYVNDKILTCVVCSK